MEDIQKDQGKILFISSFTEFGERYSYYVIQALLIFFLIDRFHISQDISSTIVGSTLGMVYISAIVGGYISDKLIGYYQAAFLGSILMIIGSYILSISTSTDILYLGLTFISISSGLIKSNISSFIGRFYDKSGLSSSHRDFGFNIFYVGINLGGFFALFFASFLKDKYGFAAPFYSSIIVTAIMFLNLLIGFFLLRKYIDQRVNLKNIILTLIILAIYSAVIFIILKNPSIANASVFVASILCLVVLFKSAQNNHWQNAFVALLFFCLSIIYWALFFQTYIAILLFLDKIVDHNFLNFSINNSQFISIESAGVILLGGVMGKIWLYFGNKGKAIYDIDKFNLGFIFLTGFFAILYMAITFSNPYAKVSIFPIIASFIIQAISELSLSAIGLSLMTKIAPRGFVSLYMGIWLVTLGIGGKIAGLLSTYINITDNIYDSKMSMLNGLKMFIAISIIGIIICLVFRKTIIKHTNY